MNAQTRALVLSEHLQLLEDPSGKRTFQEVLNTGSFQPAKSGTNFGFTQSAWWARLDIQNNDDHDIEFMLHQDYPLIDYLDVYLSDDKSQWSEIHTGDLRTFNTHPVNHQSFLIPIKLRAGQTRRVYLRFQTSGSMNIGLQLYGTQQLAESLSRGQLALGFYYGGFGALLFYNLFIFLAVRDRAFFYYLLYLLSYGLYFAVHNGLSFQYLWPDHPRWGNLALPVLLALTMLFGLGFARKFLDMRRQHPRLDLLAQSMQWLCVFCIPASLLLPYHQVILPISYLTIVCSLYLISVGAIGAWKGYKPARYFLLAWFFLIIGVLAYMLKSFGLLPHNTLTQNGFQVGALLEMLLLSVALAARVSELQQQTLTDALTGLHNRRYFDQRLEQYFSTSGSTATLLIADIDSFKELNDRHGHVKGDEVLVAVANLLRRNTPHNATVCRFGGEEFAIILPSSTEQAFSIAERIRTAVQTHFAQDTQSTLSIGVANIAQHKFSNLSQWLKTADEALYQAKQQGKNRVVFA